MSSFTFTCITQIMNYALLLLLFLSHLLSYLRNSPLPVELEGPKACLRLLKIDFYLQV